MKVIIEEYQAKWPDQFLKEKSIIAAALQSFTPTIEHIGSTAVPGLKAKPIIDILVGLNHLEDLDKIILPMQNEGYTYVKKYEPMWPTRRFFVKLQPSTFALPSLIDIQDTYIIGKDVISLVHIHVIAKDTEDWHRHIAFRDFLRSNSSIRQEYGRMKKKLSELEFTDMNEYNNAKNAFIKETEKLALGWYRQSNANHKYFSNSIKQTFH
ncbi:MAG: GrpB family protein [Bacteroidota bacterium]|nr:GrpB family protein [Bacteroidota bacterium]